MSEHIWADAYTRAVHAFDGDTPGRQLEATLIEHFEKTPEAVEAAIDKLAKRFADGRVRSPWPLVLRELENDVDRNVRADSKSERATATRRAETWIRNAGLACPWPEVEHELYDARSNGHQHSDHALLAYWADDDELRNRIHAYWQAQQPRAEHAQRLYAEHNAKAAAGYFAQLEAKRGDAPPKPASDDRPPPGIFDDTEPEPE